MQVRLDARPFGRRILSLLSCAALLATACGAYAADTARDAPMRVTGLLDVVHRDDFVHHTSSVEYQVTDTVSQRHVTLRFAGTPPAQLVRGMRVTAVGAERADGSLLLASDGASIVEQPMMHVATIQNKASALVSGVQNTIVIIANFTDAAVTLTPSQIQDLMFTDPNGHSIDALFRETSFGNVGFSGQVAGPFVIAYSTASPCNLASWADAADAAATAAGINLASYPRKLYVMPSAGTSVCGMDGAGQVGGSPSRAWVFNNTVGDVYAHELGHNLNMEHAATLANQYGDASDDMGGDGYPLRHFNAPHTEQMGWMPAGNIVTISQPGTYTVAALEISPAQAPAPQILKIAKPDSGEYYYFSYRQPLGLDSGLRSAYWNRINVHKYAGNAGATNTYLLQLLDDASIFSDSTNGITVTQLSHASDRATMRVDFAASSPTCQRSPPVLALAPSSQSALAGSTLAYTLSLTNTDNAACSASTFALAGVVPTGWAGSVSQASLTLSPGASGSATLSVTSAAAAAAASYSIALNVSDSANASHGGSAAGTDVVQAPLQGDTQAPSAPGALTASVSKRTTVSLAWQAASDNVGVVGYEIWRNGVRVATSTKTTYVETPGGGSYSYYVVAFDAAGNRSAASNTAAVTIKVR